MHLSQAYGDVVTFFAFIKTFEGEVPGTKPTDCGNYRKHNLAGAREAAGDMLEGLKSWTSEDMEYEA